MSLENRKVLITGCDRGIGLGLVKEFLNRGSVVIATAKDLSSSDELIGLKSHYKEKLLIYQLDTTLKDNHDAVKKSLQEENIHELDIVIANAGISNPEHPHDSAITSSIEDLVEVYRTNSLGTLLTFQSYYDMLAGAKLLMANSSKLGSLTIVQSSKEGDATSYRAAKAALNMYALCFSVEPRVISLGIKIICFHPGWVKTYLGTTGGQDAKIDVEESCDGILKLVTEATEIQTTGKRYGEEKHLEDYATSFAENQCVFVNYDGTIIPW